MWPWASYSTRLQPVSLSVNGVDADTSHLRIFSKSEWDYQCEESGEVKHLALNRSLLSVISPCHLSGVRVQELIRYPSQLSQSTWEGRKQRHTYFFKISALETYNEKEPASIYRKLFIMFMCSVPWQGTSGELQSFLWLVSVLIFGLWGLVGFILLEFRKQTWFGRCLE